MDCAFAKHGAAAAFVVPGEEFTCGSAAAFLFGWAIATLRHGRTRPHIASQAEASPRVDVGETSDTQVPSLDDGEEDQQIHGSFQGFCKGRGVGGHWSFRSGMACLSLSCVLSLLVESVLRLISVTSQGVVVPSVCRPLWVGQARAVGGSVPGEWFCNHCSRGGCWPTRQWYFFSNALDPRKGSKAKILGAGLHSQFVQYLPCQRENLQNRPISFLICFKAWVSLDKLWEGSHEDHSGCSECSDGSWPCSTFG